MSARPASRPSRRALAAAVLAAVWLTGSGARGTAGAPEGTDLGTVLAADLPLRAAVIGDFGYDGNGGDQASVARAMASRHAQQPLTLGLTVGDNFYPSGLRNTADQKFVKHFSRVYGALGVPFFAALGNHDYRGNEQAQVDLGQGTSATDAWRLPARYYAFRAGSVRFFALDTDEGRIAWWQRLPGFRHDVSRAQLAWLDRALQAPTDAAFTIVYGHHPLITDGAHHDEWPVQRLRRQLLPILMKHRVTAYIAGHDHNLEQRAIVQDGWTLRHFVTGGGGKNLRGRKAGTADCFRDAHGYLEIEADVRTIAFTLRGIDAEPVCTPVTAP